MKKKITLGQSVFNELMLRAEAIKYCSKEIFVSASDDLPEFMFTYNVAKGEITENGGIDLTPKQYEAICEMAIEEIEDEEPEHDAFDTIDHYQEFGLDPAMFF